MAEPTDTPYDTEFYDGLQAGSVRSAQKIVPWLLSWLPCTSVVDFGCGIGTWLSVFKSCGVDDIAGLDGEYVDRTQLLIEPHRFRPTDLTQPVRLDRRFDLATSLEVAEHLPRASAETFVDSLTYHGDVILFSAAPPYQGGTEHVNCQWPAFWANLFRARGYTCIDCVRPHFWSDEEVEWWYAQNAMIFIKASRLAEIPSVPSPLPFQTDPMGLLHPKLVAGIVASADGAKYWAEHLGIRAIAKQIPHAAARCIKHRMGYGVRSGTVTEP